MANNNQEKILEPKEKTPGAEEKSLPTIKKEAKKILGLKRNQTIAGLGIALLIIGASAGLIYWQAASGQIVIDRAMVFAPRIDLAPKTSGFLEEVFVNNGDVVPSNAVLARVGNELIKAKSAGLIIDVKKDIGELFNSGTPVVSMIDPSELRVVGQIDEDKGLADIVVGQPVLFTVDAFGSQKFTGVVDEINPSSNDSAVVFSISDKRETKQFDVKIRFNDTAHPEFKNGMSAKIIIYKN